MALQRLSIDEAVDLLTVGNLDNGRVWRTLAKTMVSILNTEGGESVVRLVTCCLECQRRLWLPSLSSFLERKKMMI